MFPKAITFIQIIQFGNAKNLLYYYDKMKTDDRSLMYE